MGASNTASSVPVSSKDAVRRLLNQPAITRLFLLGSVTCLASLIHYLAAPGTMVAPVTLISLLALWLLLAAVVTICLVSARARLTLSAVAWLVLSWPGIPLMIELIKRHK